MKASETVDKVFLYKTPAVQQFIAEFKHELQDQEQITLPGVIHVLNKLQGRYLEPETKSTPSELPAEPKEVRE